MWRITFIRTYKVRQPIVADCNARCLSSFKALSINDQRVFKCEKKNTFFAEQLPDKMFSYGCYHHYHYRDKYNPTTRFFPIRACGISHNVLTLPLSRDCLLHNTPTTLQSSSSSFHSPYALSACLFHTSVAALDKDQKSAVEQTVTALKENIKAKKEVAAVPEVKPDVPTIIAPKKTLGQRIIDELKHYYHGFRLLFIDISVSAKLAWRVLNGKSLTRREHKLLVRTVSDIFRLVPFSVFIIVPFMEFLLPVFIKFFPGMLPSTFQSKDDLETKMKTSLKVKLEMAKFLQDTLDEMGLQSKGTKRSQTAKDFALFFEKIRSSGEQASNEEIMKFSKLFEDEITLDSLSRDQLVALCKLLELQPLGTTNFLRFQLRMRLRNLIADDKIIKKEGIENLTVWELQQACKARGMRAYGVSDQRMRSQLVQWLELSLNEKIPPSLLLLSRVLYLPENIPATDQLKVTISTLPDAVATQTKAKIGVMEGKVDNKTQIEIIRDEEKKIKKEKEEKHQMEMRQKEMATLKAAAAAAAETIATDAAAVSRATVTHTGAIEPTDKDVLLDQAPVVADQAAAAEAKQVDELSSQDFDEIEDALENIAAEKKKLLIEKEELEDLKEEMAEYNEDVEELKDVIVLSGMSDKELRVSKAAQRLQKHVNRMVNRMDNIIGELEKKGFAIKQKMEQGGERMETDQDELVNIDDLIRAMKKVQTEPDLTRIEKISDVLENLDLDQDGALKVEEVLEVIELISKDDVKLNTKQMREVIEVLEKEENLEFVERVEKMMERELQHQEAQATKDVEKLAADNLPADSSSKKGKTTA